MRWKRIYTWCWYGGSTVIKLFNVIRALQNTPLRYSLRQGYRVIPVSHSSRNVMDSFSTISLSEEPKEVSDDAEKSQIPVDEEYQSSNGFAYCVIA